MFETYHINQRVRQRGIIKRMIELTLEFGELQAGKIPSRYSPDQEDAQNPQGTQKRSAEDS